MLTLFQLDSNLILINPIRSQPIETVKQTLRMFKAECLKDDIALDLCEDVSLQKHGAEWAMLDPLRLNQVNLS